MMNSSRLFLLAFSFAVRWLFASAAAASSLSSVLDTTLLYPIDQHHLITAPATQDSNDLFEVPNMPALKSALYNHLHLHLTSRQLSTFSAFNSLLSQITLTLPPTTLTTNGLTLSISQLRCSNISIQNIQINHASLSNIDQRVNIQVSGVQLTCNFRWGYKWTIFNGQGDGSAVLDAVSGAAINLHFKSDDYATSGPKDASVGVCNSNIQIADMSFTGDGLGVIASIMNWIEHLLRDRIEAELNTVVCTELGGLADEALDDLLLDLSDWMDVYYYLVEEESGCRRSDASEDIQHDNQLNMVLIS